MHKERVISPLPRPHFCLSDRITVHASMFNTRKHVTLWSNLHNLAKRSRSDQWDELTQELKEMWQPEEMLQVCDHLQEKGNVYTSNL